MKRPVLLLLTAIYLISCVGIGINRFYCCGKLASVTLTYNKENNTGNNPGKKKNCCKHEQQNFRIKDSHFNALSFSLNSSLPVLISFFTYPDNKTIANQLLAKIVYKGNAPPAHPDIPVYALNCTYRI